MVRKSFAAALLAPFLASCASFAAPSAPVLTPQQASLVQMTCNRIMGLAHSGVYREECQESLTQTLARKMEVRSMAGAYADCSRQDLREGSAAFSTCMLDRRSQPATAVAQTASLAYDAAAPENTKSYFEVSNAEHWRREQYSCAQLGLTPGNVAFDQCVADLNAALAPNPF